MHSAEASLRLKVEMAISHLGGLVVWTVPLHLLYFGEDRGFKPLPEYYSFACKVKPLRLFIFWVPYVRQILFHTASLQLVASRGDLNHLRLKH
jgi:uncharacterized membrane protein YhdT